MNTPQTNLGRIEQTSNNGFKADKTIFKTVDQARTAHQSLRQAHLRRIALYTEIKGLIQGNPIYDPNKLKSAGLEHVTNFNDMSARATIKRACLAYWNLLYNSQHLSRFIIRMKDAQAVEFADLMAQHWDYAVLTRWPSFLINIASLDAQIVTLGVSPVIFPDERDPRWRVVELHRFLVPDQAQADLDMLTTVMVETEFTIQYLWGVYQEFKDRSTDSPWNIKELAKLLVWISASPNKDPLSSELFFEQERRLANGDLSFDKRYNDTIKIVSLFQKEYNGKISHYMFHRHFTADVNNIGENFIFFEQDQYEEMNEALVIFTKSPGEFTIHANRGLGHEIYSLSQAKIMLDCSIVDMARWSSTPIIKSPSLNTKDADQIRFYPGVPTNIGGFDFIENTMGANIQNVVAAANYISNLINFNITYSGSDSAQPDPDKGSLSPTQTRLLAFREFSVLKNDIMHYYATFDRLLQNMTAKMLRSKESYPGHEIARVWKERCMADGVPEQIFDPGKKKSWQVPDHLEVYATRAAGAGSQVAHLIGLQEIAQTIAPSLGPRAASEYKRQVIIAAMGPEYVEAFMQDDDDVDERAGGASLAGVENAVMQMGKSPIFSPDNEHRSHAVTHLALLAQIKGAVDQKQMDVIEADRQMTVAVPHTGEHIQILQNNILALEFFQKVEPIYNDFVKYATLMRKNAIRALETRQKQQQQQAEQQQKVMTDEELKTMQVTNEERRKDMKLQAQSQRQERAGQAKEEALKERTQGELDIKRQKVQGENQIKAEAERGKREAEDGKDEGGGLDETLARIGSTVGSPFNPI